ncbi:uncharacterized protein LOC109847124 [Asparagus officinalis]|uniref:uncharacterized protein LOC109847124 n=1 Tax=Asparagus officinalis TaxID=4686 RepID=UPI00098E7CBF|nr:uncharacterized protein LOC109847124 [Asparagus officinalis]
MPRSSSSGSDDAATTGAPINKLSGVTLHYPMLTKMNYAVWAIKIRVYLQAQGVWDAIEPGTDVETRKDKMALAAIYEAIPEKSLLLIAEKETAEKAWQTLKTMYEGADHVKAAKLQTLRSEFEILRMNEMEAVDDFAEKLTAIVSKIASLGDKLDESTVVKKLLRVVPNKFLTTVTSIEQFVDLTTMTVEEAIGRLKTFEERVRASDGDDNEHVLLTWKEWNIKEKESSEGSNSGTSKGRGKGNWHDRGCGRGQGHDNGRTEEGHDDDQDYKKKIKCYNCNYMG